jgi:ABC-type proline/glycine betaine transport system permease subunit
MTIVLLVGLVVLAALILVGTLGYLMDKSVDRDEHLSDRQG